MDEKIKELVNEIKAIAPSDCSAIEIFLNNYTFDVKFIRRSPESLRSESISMKNINGEWIS